MSRRLQDERWFGAGFSNWSRDRFSGRGIYVYCTCTPAVNFLVIHWAVHDDSTLQSERLPLKRLGQAVAPHKLCGTVFYTGLSTVNTIFDKIISDVDMLGSLGARSSPVLGKQNGTPIILFNYVFRDLVALAFEEVSRPEHLR